MRSTLLSFASLAVFLVASVLHSVGLWNPVGLGNGSERGSCGLVGYPTSAPVGRESAVPNAWHPPGERSREDADGSGQPPPGALLSKSVSLALVVGGDALPTFDLLRVSEWQMRLQHFRVEVGSGGGTKTHGEWIALRKISDGIDEATVSR